MGRPPIGKTAMTSTERSRRYRADLATKHAMKPSPAKDQERIRELEAELAQARKHIAEQETPNQPVSQRAEADPPRARRVTETPKRERITRLIAKLGSDNDNEVLHAARLLEKTLRDYGSNLGSLGEAWEKEEERLKGPEPVRPKPVDWSEVEAAVTHFADGKSTVSMNAVLKAVHTAVPKTPRKAASGDYVGNILIRLGFKRSRSGLSYTRKAD